MILQCDQDSGKKSFIVALDKKTGEQVWKMPRQVQASWATPLLVETPRRTELVTSGNEWIISYNPATGQEHWRCKGLGSFAIPSPVASGNVVIVASGYPSKRVLAVELGGSGDITESPKVLWKYAKGTAYVPSPLVYHDYLYLMTDKGLVSCLDIRTGEVLYEGKRVPVPATFMASPIGYEGKILLCSEDGDGFLFRAGPKHEILRTNALGEAIEASPAVAHGNLFIRGTQHLFCVGASTGSR